MTVPISEHEFSRPKALEEFEKKLGWNVPKFVDGEVILGSHCFCGFRAGNPSSTDDKHRFREHLRYCKLYIQWIDKVFPIEELALKIPLTTWPKCQFCDCTTHIKLHGIKICIQCKKPFEAPVNSPKAIYIEKERRKNGSGK
jgi:hypothetical protein